MLKCPKCGKTDIVDSSEKLEKPDMNYSYECSCGNRFTVREEDAVRCDYCNSRNTVLVQVTEKEFAFYCNRCGEVFEIERTEHQIDKLKSENNRIISELHRSSQD